MEKLLEGVQDINQFRRAFCPGFQEYVEAVTFLSLLDKSYLPSIKEILDETAYKNCENILSSEVLLGMADIAGI